MPQQCCVIQIDRGTLRMLVGRFIGRSVRVSQMMSVPLESSDQGLLDALRSLEVSKGPVVLAVPRADAVMKSFAVPAELVGSGEWLGMARLQLQRHVQLDPADAVIDAMLLGESHEPQALAAAVDAAAIERIRSACREAGLRLVGAELLASGVAMFGGAGAAVVIAPSEHATEIVASVDHVPVFGRSIDASNGLGDPDMDPLDRIAARTAVEVKRTMIGARAAGLREDPARVVVLGHDALADGIASACELELGLQPGTGDIDIDWPRGTSSDVTGEYAPLAGIVARRGRAVDAIDFLSIHRPPDTTAKRRQLLLLAVLLVVTVVGGFFAVASMRLSSLRQELTSAEKNAGESFEQLGTFLARDARLSHAEQWVRAGQDWVPSIETIAAVVGGVEGTSLGELRADARASVGFDAGQRVPYPGTWSRETQATFRISGDGVNPASARALRQSFLDASTFHVLTQGPDSGADFAFDLISASRAQDGGEP